MIHAITQSKGNGRPRSPSPAKVPTSLRQPSPKPGDSGRKRDSFFFKGCFRCGSEDHKRQECKAFQKVLADAPNNKGKDSKDWKIPQGYKGAFDKARAKFRKDNADKRRKDKVNSPGADAESEDESDSGDEDFSAPVRRSTLCALNNAAWEAAQITDRIDSAANQAHHNSFEALNDDDDSGMIAQLSSWAHVVKTGGAFQKARKL